MIRRTLSAFFVLLGIACPALAEDAALPPRERFHLYLLVGQSNMAGRGKVEPADTTPDARVLTFAKDDTWKPAVEPLHWDKPAAGVGPGLAFGREIIKTAPGITVGLIPCAVGGSPIDAWQPGAYYPPTKSHPWDDALRRATLALRHGTLKGILWHQGEADSKPGLAPAYEARLHDLVKRLRQALQAPEVPFIAGQMGRFPSTPWKPEAGIVDAAHRSLPQKLPNTAFVTSDGLTDKGDGVHFDAASYRELGRRYAEAWKQLSQRPPGS